MKKLLSILAIGTGIGALVLLAGNATVQAKPGFGKAGKCDTCHTAKPPKKANAKKPCKCDDATADKKAACVKACK